MSVTLRVVIVMALMGGLGVARAESDGARREALERGVAAFDQAVSLQRSRPEEARVAYRSAAESFEAAANGALRNPQLEYNLGNTYFRLDDLGRSVLHLRRAAQLAPGDERIRANLRFVRERVTPMIVPPEGNRLMRSVLFLHDQTSPRSRLTWGLVAGVVGWGCLLARVWSRRPMLLTVGVIGATVGLACAASAIWQLRDEEQRPAAVVLRSEILRIGRGDGHDAALSQPLGPGVEVRVVEERAGWLRLELADQKTGWMPVEAVARV